MDTLASAATGALSCTKQNNGALSVPARDALKEAADTFASQHGHDMAIAELSEVDRRIAADAMVPPAPPVVATA